MTHTTKPTTGLGEIIGRFDLFLIDQFGVLHDGRAPYPGAVEALASIKRAGKTAIILTNSGKRAAPNTERLIELGFPRTTFDDVVSSGEVGWHSIKDGRLGAPFVRGARVYVIGRRGDDYGLNGLDLRFTDNPALAEVILILGTDAPATSLVDYRAILAPAALAGVPALGSNPDKLMHTSSGLQPAPGAIAEVFEQLGGRVRLIGKPYPDIYRYALALAPGVPPARVLAIGDSVEHDIAGAARMGFASLLIQGGILTGVTQAGLSKLYKQYGTWPDYFCGRLSA